MSRAAAQRRRGEQAVVWCLVAAFAALAVLGLPLTVLAAIGLMPTFAAWIGETGPHRYRTLCIGAMNLCGVAPIALQLWRKGAGPAALSDLLSDPFAWFAMYGAAAVGWLIFQCVPPLVEAAIAHRVRTQREALLRRQAALAEEWGEELRAP